MTRITGLLFSTSDTASKTNPSARFRIEAPRVPGYQEVIHFPRRGAAAGFSATVKSVVWDFDGTHATLRIDVGVPGARINEYRKASEEDFGEVWDIPFPNTV